MVEVMVSELLAMTTDLTDVEFARAKNKFKSDMFMDLESRIVQIDDVIRQVGLRSERKVVFENQKQGFVEWRESFGVGA